MWRKKNALGMDTTDHSENVANISDEHTARLATTSAVLSPASTTATIGFVAVIMLCYLHPFSTRKAGSPGIDGLLETVTMEDTPDARQVEANCKFRHRPRYIPKLNQNSKRDNTTFTHTALTEGKWQE